MSLLKTHNPIALRLFMTDDLYFRDENTEQSQDNISSESPGSFSFDYTGENNKYILILINDIKQDSINAADVETLTIILTARGLALRDVAIVNLNKYPSGNFNQMKEFFSCSKLILFGISPRQIGLPDIDNNKINMHEGTRILATYSFNEMQDDTVKKRLFWNEMKQL